MDSWDGSVAASSGHFGEIFASSDEVVFCDSYDCYGEISCVSSAEESFVTPCDRVDQISVSHDNLSWYSDHDFS